MAESPLRVAIIIGSNRKGRFGPVVADWFAGQARDHGAFEVDTIDLAQAWLPEVLTADGDEVPGAVRSLGGWLRAADAFVIVTPEYNRGYPAALKNAIDWYGDEWRTKPVAYVSYGGSAGGLRAVQALQPVFTELYAVNVRETVSFHNYPERFDPRGRPTDPAGCEGSARRLLDQLAWWARTLRDGRARAPYPQGGGSGLEEPGGRGRPAATR
ncbi:NAD(P)H-dependent oxidoreductase [Nocardiopsis sp. RSe5-2]|uniref:NAD(P)H-dependent oxidoreductase n=1 Tax=Nocardiopsis endophytica TaxID=3018445 RepID=A0ABT4U8J6_9ACTN|nr:NAD(P)H-dependent oxidoreductase [Nocardiopsis endophytica]MDA2813272.1 NAD(P)H-dependent oxidoreductase [Nocardiopsis endophytica]